MLIDYTFAGEGSFKIVKGSVLVINPVYFKFYTVSCVKIYFLLVTKTTATLSMI